MAASATAPWASHGARLEKLCQLRVDDLIEHQGIRCIRIDDNREGQNLKNSSSRRILPVHPALVAMGLLEHVESVRDTGIDRLFPELEAVRGNSATHRPNGLVGTRPRKASPTSEKRSTVFGTHSSTTCVTLGCRIR